MDDNTKLRIVNIIVLSLMFLCLEGAVTALEIFPAHPFLIGFCLFAALRCLVPTFVELTHRDIMHFFKKE
jgi:hypothetical protein